MSDSVFGNAQLVVSESNITHKNHGVRVTAHPSSLNKQEYRKADTRVLLLVRAIRIKKKKVKKNNNPNMSN